MAHRSGAIGDERDEGFDRWLNRQLHSLYDPVLAEAVPDEILRLLHQFDVAQAPSVPDEPGVFRHKRERG